MIFDALMKNADGYALAFRANDITSKDMRRAIPEWFDLYFRKEPSKDEDPCQQIPYTVVSMLTRTVFSEYEASSDDSFAGALLDALADVKNKAMQLALIGGEAKLKPVIEGNKFIFNVVPRYNILVFGRDASGNMTDIGTVEKVTADKGFYTLLERRTVDEKGFLTIRNRLFRSYDDKNLGQEVPLNSLPQYELLEPEYTYLQPVGSVGLVSLSTPMVNCVDGSADHVSVYASATGLIHNINRNEAQLNGEFSRGESRVIISGDMLKDGKLQDHLFVGLDEDAETIGITQFSPALREESFLARKQEYLRNVESVIGLKRGLLSEVEAAERTATEITSSAGTYNLTIIDFQTKWENTVKEAVRLCGILGQMYKVPEAHEVKEDAISISFGNGILYDETKTWEDYKAMVAAGLLQPEIALGWRFDMPTETEEDLAAIRNKYMPVATEEGML